jgi:hypothetical protein
MPCAWQPLYPPHEQLNQLMNWQLNQQPDGSPFPAASHLHLQDYANLHTDHS